MSLFSFQSSRPQLPWTLPPNYKGDLEPDGLYAGPGTNALEVVIAKSSGSPSTTDIKELFRRRWNRRAAPVLLVVSYRGAGGEDRVAFTGLSGEDPKFRSDQDPAKLEAIIDHALDLDRHRATEFLMLNMLGVQPAPNGPGIRNHGLIAQHIFERFTEDELAREDQPTDPLNTDSAKGLIRSLGYQISDPQNGVSLLTIPGEEQPVALAVFLYEEEDFDRPSPRHRDLSPVANALGEADNTDGVDFVIIGRGATLRLYMANLESKYGRPGRAAAFVEVNLDLLAPNQKKLLPKLFGPASLQADPKQGRSVPALLEQTSRFASDLGNRLKERVYQRVLPELVKIVSHQFDPQDPQPQEKLEQLYQMTMTILFRLLFVAYAEDHDLLPYEWNEEYRELSLNTLARELSNQLASGKTSPAKAQTQPTNPEDPSTTTDPTSTPDQTDPTSFWQRLQALWGALDTGSEWLGIPFYIGGLFSSRDESRGYGQVSSIGKEIARLSVPDPQIRSVLAALLVDELPGGGYGPVDFRQLAAEEFGTIYETLLEWELVWADQDLTQNRQGQYLPAKEGDQIAKRKGEVYLDRKLRGNKENTSTYFTPSVVVQHLLNHTLDPAIEHHLSQVYQLLSREENNRAAEKFWDFKLADICMGSGNFLTAALDRITTRFTDFLNDNAIPRVEHLLDRMRKSALDGQGVYWHKYELERKQLVRRLVARHCLYGVDIDPLAVELTRFAIWLKTFVPGLPLPYLGHNLLCGDSLVGIGNMSEARNQLTNNPLYLDSDVAQIDTWYGRAKDPITRLETLNDVSYEEIKDAEQANHDAFVGLFSLKGLFDILVAQRLDGYPSLDNLSGRGVANYVKDHKVDDLIGELRPVHFPLAFPEVFAREQAGFDVILGNPPQEVVKLNEKNWWRNRFRGIRSLKGGDVQKAIKVMEQTFPALADQLANEIMNLERKKRLYIKAIYTGSMHSNPDLFEIFAWRVLQVVKQSGGYAGVNLQYDLFFGQHSIEWRQAVFNRGNFLDVTRMRNFGKWIRKGFKPRFLAIPTSIHLDSEASPYFTVRGPYRSRGTYDQAQQAERGNWELEPATVSKEEIRKWTYDLSVPWLYSQGYKQIVSKIFEAPPMISDAHNWDVRVVNRFPEKSLISQKNPSDTSEMWPVYSASSLGHWEIKPEKKLGWGETAKIVPTVHQYCLRASNRSDSPFYMINMEETGLPCYSPRIAYRRHRTSEARTMVPTLVPSECFLSSYAPYLFFRSGSIRDEAYLLGVLSSLPCDWYTDKVIDWFLNNSLVESLPIPSVSELNLLRRRVELLVANLNAKHIDHPGFEEWVTKVLAGEELLADFSPDDAIAELDALVGLLYGLSKAELSYVYTTSPDAHALKPRMELALEYYDKWLPRA